ncbi:MAG TPA: glycoside hydrolase family 3 N-terminal domain-containing protein [Steroidobacteraceae bacterium]|nr:glycoside hydrolase family 3 N-terminal domain-containing protein [Steroidobacteraceae bacterium]
MLHRSWRLAWIPAMALLASAAEPPAASPPVPPTPVHPESWPAPASPLRPDAKLEQRVAQLLARMTLEEKIGQVIQPDIGSVTPEDMRRYHFGSILNGGNSAPDKDEFAPPQKWLALADAFYAASVDRSNGGVGIPMIWGTDAVHGHSNIIGATLFPHNIGLGAMRNPRLVEAIGAATAREIRATGMDWTFAPTLTVPQDTRWGRTYEGYSEDPSIVVSYAAAMVRGLQGRPGSRDFLRPPHVIATAKHFLGDGGTANGRDQGDTVVTEAVLRDTHGAPYVPAIEAGLMSVMASYNSWNGTKLHGHRGLLTEVLKERMGFQGFIVGDWNGHGQVRGCRPTNCPDALLAGLDMYMAPDSWRGLHDSLLAQARDGTLPMARLDDAVARILRVKFRMGLFEAGPPSSRPGGGDFATLGHAEHRALARQAVRESLVLLKNNGGLLPLHPKQRVLVTGDGAHNYAKQSGGWTLTWQGTGADNSRFPGATSIWEGIRDNVQRAGGSAELSADGSWRERPDVAVVVFGENPYAEGVGDIRTLLLRTDGGHLEVLARLNAAGIPVVAVFLSGRPLWVNRELNSAQAFVAAWLPGSEGSGVADVLFRRANGRIAHDFRGKLSFSWPKHAAQYGLHRDQPGYDPLFPFGFGLTYRDRRELPQLPEDSGVSLQEAPGTTLFDGTGPAGWTVAGGGALRWSRVDRLRQEDSLQLVWPGGGAGALGFDSARGEDFSRETNADMLLVLTLKVDAAPDGGMTVTAHCGAGCQGSVAIEAALRALPAGQWQRVGIPLKCFTAAGATTGQRFTRIELGSSGRAELTLHRAALGTDADRRVECTAR